MVKHSLKLGKGNIKIQFLKPVSAAEYNIEQRNELVEKVRNQIIAAFDPYYR
jgi:hypothetical protein